MNRRFFLALIIIIIFNVETKAQQPELSGYYENQFFPQELNGKIILQDYNKLRLDLSASVGENISFNGDFIYRTFHGATELNAFDFIPGSVVQKYAEMVQIPLEILRPSFNLDLKDENFLDNAFVTLYFNRVNVRIGKQQLPWGTGYSWNPTDIFNDKNLLDPAYEKTGVNAFKLEASLGSQGMATGILSVGDEWKTTTKALKIEQHFGRFDLSVSFVEKWQKGFDYTAAVSTSERRRLWGGDFSGELLGLGVWGEGAYNQMEASNNFGQYLIGGDYTFESGLYLTGEYYLNEWGKADKNQYTFNDWMRLLSADGQNLGQDYVFLGQRYPVAELWNWSNYLLLNLNDNSGLAFPWFDFSLSDNAEVMLVGYIPFGEKETEYGEFGMGGFARVRVYF